MIAELERDRDGVVQATAHEAHLLGQLGELAFDLLHAPGQRLDLRLHPLHAHGEVVDALRQRRDLCLHAAGELVDATAERLDLLVVPPLALRRFLPLALLGADEAVERLLQAPHARRKLQKLLAEQRLKELTPEGSVFADPPEPFLRQPISRHCTPSSLRTVRAARVLRHRMRTNDRSARGQAHPSSTPARRLLTAALGQRARRRSGGRRSAQELPQFRLALLLGDDDQFVARLDRRLPTGDDDLPATQDGGDDRLGW